MDEIRMPLIGEAAPEFTADSTTGKIDFPTDYKGRWVILFSHPGDFTPVCTSEILLFGAMCEEFEDMNCSLVGLSVGSVNSHIAWQHSIYDRIEYRGHKNVRIKFPLVADVSMDIARRYGMLHPTASDTAAVRAVFFIDPKGIIRATLYYPLTLGRNFAEMKRMLSGLQAIDKHGIALPADWQPGEDVIVPAPSSYDGSNRRTADAEGMRCYEWYFCTRPMPDEPASMKDKIKEAVGIK